MDRSKLSKLATALALAVLCAAVTLIVTHTKQAEVYDGSTAVTGPPDTARTAVAEMSRMSTTYYDGVVVAELDDAMNFAVGQDGALAHVTVGGVVIDTEQDGVPEDDQPTLIMEPAAVASASFHNSNQVDSGGEAASACSESGAVSIISSFDHATLASIDDSWPEMAHPDLPTGDQATSVTFMTAIEEPSPRSIATPIGDQDALPPENMTIERPDESQHVVAENQSKAVPTRRSELDDTGINEDDSGGEAASAWSEAIACNSIIVGGCTIGDYGGAASASGTRPSHTVSNDGNRIDPASAITC